MKKIVYTLCLFSALSLSGQSAAYFNKLVFPWIDTATNVNHLKSIVPFNNNYLILSSWVYIDSINGRTQVPSLIHLSPQGNILNKRVYLDSNHIYYFIPANSLLAVSDSTFLIAGCRWNKFTGSKGRRIYPFLMKVDANFDTICTRVFAHPDTLAASQPGARIDYRFNCIRETWDKGFIVSGHYNLDCVANTERSFLMKLDSLFNVEWFNKYSSVGVSYNVEIAADSGYYFVSMNKVNEIYKYDKHGCLQWQVNTNLSPPAIGFSGPVDLKEYDQNTLYVASGYWRHPKDDLRGFLISKVDIPTRTVVWEKYYIMFNNIKCFHQHQHMRLLIAKDGNLIVCANANYPNPLNPNEAGFKGFIAKLTPDGDSIWARHLGYGDYENYCQIHDIIITDDEGFLTIGIYVGWKRGNLYEDAWIARTDSLGCDTPGCHLIGISELEMRNEKLEIFPNPFRDKLHIVLPERFWDGKLVMYDLQGRKAVEITVPQNYGKQTFTIKTPELKPGMYLLELAAKDERVWRRKVLKSN